MYKYDTVIIIKDLGLEFKLTERLKGALSVMSETAMFIKYVTQRIGNTFIQSMIWSRFENIVYKDNSYTDKAISIQRAICILNYSIENCVIKISVKNEKE